MKRQHPPTHARRAEWTGTIDMRADLKKRRELAEIANNAMLDALLRYGHNNDAALVNALRASQIEREGRA